MFYLFSSDSTPRYKRNILDTLCYPEGHIFRFRYQDKYVSDEITNWTIPEIPNQKFKGSTLSERIEEMMFQRLEERGRKGVIVYAEHTGYPPNREFNFFPIREIEIIRIKVEGSIYYVDFKFGQFINYYRGLDHERIKLESSRQQKAAEYKRDFQTQINATKYHPLPSLTEDTNKIKQGKMWNKDTNRIVDYDVRFSNTTQGYFLHHIPHSVPQQTQPPAIDYLTGQTLDLSFTDEISPNLAWESIIDLLSVSPSMDHCIFYRVMGFYQVAGWFVGLGGKKERKVELSNDGWSTKYPLPMGREVVLKLLFYRSEYAHQIPVQKFEIRTDGDAFAGFSEKQLFVLSQYNEERIQIACKRVFDSVLAPISIERTPDPTYTDDNKILAPHPYLLSRIVASWWTVGITLFFLISAAILLSLGPDFLTHIGNSQILQGREPAFGNWIFRNAGDLSLLTKTLGALSTLIAGLIGFRKLPIGK